MQKTMNLQKEMIYSNKINNQDIIKSSNNKIEINQEELIKKNLPIDIK